MSDIDLVPASYRQHQRFRRYLRLFIVTYAVLVLCTGASKAVLVNALDTESAAIDDLNEDQAALLDRKARLEDLRDQQTHLTKRLQVLEKLRGGPPVKAIFLAIDRALDGKVWFVDWEFLRAGEYVPVQPRTSNRGYFIVIPSEQVNGRQRAWQMATHMKIRGRATAHSALANFVSRLSREAVFGEVKIIDTRVQSGAAGAGVDFELAVIVDPSARAS